VLVGGLSRRMGKDKALMDFRGEPLARRVARRLRRVCRRVVIVGGAGRGYEALGLPWWPDPPDLAGRGPLAGLIAALERAPAVLLVACDLPFMEPCVLRRLLRRAGQAPVAIPIIDGRLEPLAALYRRPALAAARDSLAAGSGRMGDLLQSPGARLIPGGWLGPPSLLELAFRNLNTPADLTTAGPAAGPGGGG
jgi:molybdopterin-guanine dinucleotide biosynthesis protein A